MASPHSKPPDPPPSNLLDPQSDSKFGTSNSQERFDAVNPCSFKLVLLKSMADTEESETYFQKELQGLDVEEVMADQIGSPINLPAELKEKICQPWRDALILKLVGANIRYKSLHNKIINIWRPKGTFQLIDLGYEYFILKFQMKDDISKAFDGGPWFIGENFLSVQKWKPDFHPASSSITSRAAWVRILDLPMENYDPRVHEIAKTIGKPLKIDHITIAKTRGRFARFCIEILLDRPLVTSVKLGSVTLQVQYENIQKICFRCGKVGHEKYQCILAPTVIDREDSVMDEDELGDKEKEPFGPWMMVNKKMPNFGPVNQQKKPIPKVKFMGWRSQGTKDDFTQKAETKGSPQLMKRNKK